MKRTQAPMRAVVLRKPGTLVVEERPRPQPAPGEVLIRVTHSGVCGTDLKIFRGDIPVTYPLIMGHEMVGEVVEGDTHLPTGTPVIVDPVIFCGRCYHCRVGQTHLCPNGTLLGRDQHGGFADYLVAPAANIYPLPAQIDIQVAPLIQVLTTCLHAQRLVALFPGETVVVLGLGVTGQLHVQLARARGAHPVIGVTRSSWKRDLARQLGAHFTVAPDEAHTLVMDVTDGRGADVVIECVGKPATVAQAVDLLRAGGRILLFGILTTQELHLPFYQLYYKEIRLVSARAAKPEDYQTGITLVRQGTVQLASLVTQTLPLTALERAIQRLAGDGGQSLKIILEHTS